ncbi:MAG: Lrp/AsnC ligand binding domain-containing protein [Deltaproteobacteria bacterium]
MSNLLETLLRFHVKEGHVKSFKEAQEKEGAFDMRDLGIQKVPVDRIVGSVGRYQDFDTKFRMKKRHSQERLDSVRKFMQEGKPLPPVRLYQIKEEYYVLDGNHRIAVAKEFGYSEMDARVIEYFPSEKTAQHILEGEKLRFKERTGLREPIDLTEVGQYGHLIEQIERHQRYAENIEGRPLSLQKAAAEWHKTIYVPLAGIIEKTELLRFFPNRSVGDLYVFISFHQWEKGTVRKYGRGIDELLCKDMEEFRGKMSDKKETGYPEMVREITAFVLMSVSGKREDRIIEKLYDLKEVREIYSVHGDVDVLVKIVLTRDLISSDAETIGQFVHNQVRKIPGVISTQTLIPSMSKIKSS